MAKLSDAKLRALKATGKAQKIFDGGGLYIFCFTYRKQGIAHLQPL